MDTLLNVTGFAGIATALGKFNSIILGAVTGWTAFGRRRTQRWQALFEGDAWRTCHPLLIEEAFTQAYGYELSERDIRFALGRRNPRALFRVLRLCKGMVRLNDAGMAYMHWRGAKVRRWSYMHHAWLVHVLGYVPFAVLLFFGSSIARHLDVSGQWALIGGAVIWWFMNLVCAAWFEAAHKVVAELDERFPVWDPPLPSKDGKAASVTVLQPAA
ncbi:hypothetical protein P3W24_18330 [Luteibacter sp. PPL201]|uniref:Glycosyl-4,4'-diaponeurosporenoate acyltransferase n=1 Tax=Luteibacter sahnii TaxID=3021977 RepID=A0ABT6BFR1_9GAMM